MPDQSPILSLPLIQPAQAQKHVTHNEALMRLDLLVQLTVSDRTQTTPPLSPVDGQRHIVAVGATGAWAGQEGTIAIWQDGLWQFLAPLAGWQAWVVAESSAVAFDGTAWVAGAAPAIPPVLSVTQVGISATPDATNRLSVAAPSSLFNHAGAGHQLKLNKATAPQTASLLFQTGFSGRAEFGTTGNDDLSLKVSPDGSSFTTALKVGAADARVEVTRPLLFAPHSSDPAGLVDGAVWHNSTSGQLKARTFGATRVLDGQLELPWFTPPSGEYVLTTMGSGGSTSVLAGALNRIDLYPFTARGEIAADLLGVNCTTAVAAALCKIVVYSADALGRPDTLLLETGTLDLATTGNKTIAAPITLLQGRLYWLGVRHNSTATLAAWGAQATPDLNGGNTMVTTARKILRRTVTFASPAPSPWGFLASEISGNSATAIWMRIA